MSSRPESLFTSPRRRTFVQTLRKRAVAELAAYLLLALVSTWPLAHHIVTCLPLGTEQAATVPLLNVWTVWWNADRAAHAYRSYWDAPIFAPTPGTFAFSEPMPTTVVVAPLIWFGGQRILAYNVFLLGALTLNGWTTFRLLRCLRLRWLVCLLGGGMAEMLPLVHSELGVLQMVPLCGIVWTIHALYRFARRPGLKRAVLVGVAFAVTYLTCAYYGVFLSILLVLSSGWLLGKRLRRRRTWCLLPAGAGLALLLVAPVVAAQVQTIRTHDLRRPRDWVARLSADPQDYAVAPWRQWWEADLPAALRPQRYFRLGPGWLKIALAVVGVAAGVRCRRYRAWTAFWLTMLVAAFLLSLGPKLSLRGWSPYGLLMDWYPGLGQARNVYRFAAFAQLAVVLLAALGLQAVWTSVRGRGPTLIRRGAVWGAGLLAMAEVIPAAQPLFPVAPLTSQCQWINWLTGHTPSDSLIVCIPFPKGTNVAAYEETATWMYWGSYHRRRLVNGYSGFFPASFLETKTAMRDFPDQAAVQRLRQLGVAYCVIRRGAVPRETELGRQFEFLFRDDAAQVDVYRLRPDDPLPGIAAAAATRE